MDEPPRGGVVRIAKEAKSQQGGSGRRGAATSRAYRIHFSITDKQRSWVRSPRRSIRCGELTVVVTTPRVFGLAPCDGSTITNNKGEGEHVELILSKSSGRVTNLIWNHRDITKQVRFRDHAFLANNVACGWSLPTGQSIQIQINRSETVASERDRYDLLLDGESFSELPRASDIERLNEVCRETRSPSSDERSSKSSSQHACRTDTDGLPVSLVTTKRVGSDLKYRLAMAGIEEYSFTTDLNDEPKDELHSERYSPVVESLRGVIIKAMPQTEHTVSRAIMTGFCSDTSSRNSVDSISIDGWASPLEVEANLLRDAHYWSQGNSEARDEERLHFFEGQLEEVMHYVRAETLDAADSSRVALNIAAILGLRMASKIPQTTVLIDGIPIGFDEQELYAAFGEYGNVSAAAASSTLRFGFCRFEEESAAARVVSSSAFPGGGVTLEGTRPSLFLVECEDNYTVPHNDSFSSTGIPLHITAGSSGRDTPPQKLSAETASPTSCVSNKYRYSMFD